jgi:hypothetical protein
MAVNPNIEPPTFVPIDTTSGDQVFPLSSTLRGIDVWGAGDIHFKDILGNSYGPYTVAAPFPIRITGQIRTIVHATTTVTDANLVGLR